MSAALFLAVQELLKLQFLASYAFLAAGSPLPFLPLSLAFFASILISAGLKRAGSLPVFIHLLAHLAGAALVGLATSAAFDGFPPTPAGIAQTFARSPVTAWLGLACLAAFWIRGVWLEAAPRSHEFAVTRFDEGLALLFVALIMTALIKVENPAAGRLSLSYLVFAALALAISRRRSSGRGGFAAPGKGAVVAAYAGALALSAYGIAELTPLMTEPAGAAAAFLGRVGLGFIRLIEAALVWLFTPRRLRFAQSDQVTKLEQAAEQGQKEAASPFVTILVWVLVAVVSLFALFLLFMLLRQLFALLGRRVPASRRSTKGPGLFARLAAFFARLRRFWARMAARLSPPVPRGPALAAYAKLLACGRAGGVRRARNETPREYAGRVGAAFPKQADAARLIVGAVEREVYGNRPADAATEQSLRSARAGLRRGAFLLGFLERRTGGRARGKPILPA